MYTIDFENKIISLKHDVGFFSICTQNLRALVGECSLNKIFLTPDTSQQWSYYKDNPQDNVYNKYFKYLDFEFELGSNIFSHSNEEDQFSDYKMINYEYVNKFVFKYFSLSDEVIFLENELVKKYNIDFEQTIAVLYRGNDKCKETVLPTYDDVDAKLAEIRKDNPNFKVIFQSDENEFCDFMKKYDFGIFFEEMKKIDRTPNQPIQHFIENGEKVKTAQMFLAILSIVSKCKHVVLNSGNVGMWACLLRGNATNVHQYLNKKYPINYYWL